MKGQSRLEVRKHFFSQKIVNEWHKVSADCVHSSSINMFRNIIDNYLEMDRDNYRKIHIE